MAFFGFACFNICLLDSCSSQKLFMAIDSLYYWEEGSIAVHATEQSTTAAKRRRDLYWMLLLHPSAFMAQFVSNWWLCNRPRSVEIHSHVKNVHRVICHQNSRAGKQEQRTTKKLTHIHATSNLLFKFTTTVAIKQTIKRREVNKRRQKLFLLATFFLWRSVMAKSCYAR